MEEKTLQALNDVGYVGPLLQRKNFFEALDVGPKHVEYTKLVNFLTNELRVLCNIDEEVNAIDVPEDSVSFIMEVTSFLKELNCPYSSLLHGHISDRLQNVADRCLLLDYLATELMAARILQEKKPDRSKSIELKLHESEEAANMRKILMTLRFPKPPPNITVPALFQKVVPSVKNAVAKAGSDLVGQPAFNGFLTEKQWDILNDIQKNLQHEYTIRREMLITRLDVTIQSFQWSDRTKGKDDLFEKLYGEKRTHLKAESNVNLADLLAARSDIAIIEKTSNSLVRRYTQSKLNKVIIGEVPDRGGRTSEQVPPPPEMPSWQQRQGPPASAGGRGGGGHQYSRGGGGGGGGPSRGNEGGGYYDNRNFDSAGSYTTYDNRNSYDNNNYDRGGYNQGRNNYEGNNKRAKTYDSFQSNRTTYTDQYVEDSQRNQQYGNRGGYRGNSGRGGGGRGRGNYNRGGGRNNYY